MIWQVGVFKQEDQAAQILLRGGFLWGDPEEPGQVGVNHVGRGALREDSDLNRASYDLDPDDLDPAFDPNLNLAFDLNFAPDRDPAHDPNRDRDIDRDHDPDHDPDSDHDSETDHNLELDSELDLFACGIEKIISDATRNATTTPTSTVTGTAIPISLLADLKRSCQSPNLLAGSDLIQIRSPLPQPPDGMHPSNPSRLGPNQVGMVLSSDCFIHRNCEMGCDFRVPQWKGVYQGLEINPTYFLQNIPLKTDAGFCPFPFILNHRAINVPRGKLARLIRLEKTVKLNQVDPTVIVFEDPNPQIPFGIINVEASQQASFRASPLAMILHLGEEIFTKNNISVMNSIYSKVMEIKIIGSSSVEEFLLLAMWKRQLLQSLCVTHYYPNVNLNNHNQAIQAGWLLCGDTPIKLLSSIPLPLPLQILGSRIESQGPDRTGTT